ncbi:MAG TPA: hypothetical protein VGN57_08295 [Pirellulaceae bacterium]|nr:hypothetical protein [Pirellulaceae bacterium]
MSKTYRPKDRDLWLNVACLAFFLLVGAASVAFCLFQPEFQGSGNRFAVATFFGLLWSGFASLAAWEIVAWSRRELTISGQRIARKEVFGETVLRNDAVREVRWHATPRRRVELRGKSPDGREASLAIDLAAADRREALEIVRALRNNLAQAEHVGWDRFCRRYALPLRDAVNGVERPLRPDERRLSRKRWLAIFLPSLALFAAFGGNAYFVTGEARYLALPLVLLPLWALVHFTYPREGTVVRRRSPEERKWSQILVWSSFVGLVLIVAAASLLPLLGPSPFPEWIIVCWFLGALVAFFSLFAWIGSRLAEAQQEHDALESLGASREWDEGEEIVYLE